MKKVLAILTLLALSLLLWLFPQASTPSIPMSPSKDQGASSLESEFQTEADAPDRDSAHAQSTVNTASRETPVANISVWCTTPTGAPQFDVPFWLVEVDRRNRHIPERLHLRSAISKVRQCFESPGKVIEGASRQLTDRDGVARWGNVVPDRTYIVASERMSTVHFEGRPTWLERSSDRTKSGDEPLSFHTDLLHPKLGSQLQVHAIASESASIAGIAVEIPKHPGDGGGVARVEIAHVARTMEPDGQPLTMLLGEWAGHTDTQGRFQSGPLVPGRKRITLYWCNGGTDYYFINRFMDLSAGEQRDLGSLHTLAGPVFETCFAFANAAGTVIDVERVLTPSPQANRVFVSFFFGSYVGDQPEAFEITIPITHRWDLPFRAHGLHPGQYDLSAPDFKMPYRFKDNVKSTFVFENAVYPDKVPARMLCRVAETTELTVKLRAAELGNPNTMSMQFNLLPLDGQNTERFNHSPKQLSSSECVIKSRVDAGRYRLMGSIVARPKDLDSPHWYVDEEIRVTADEPAEFFFDLRPGAALMGHAEQRNELRILSLTIVMGEASGSVEWRVSFKTDEDGQYRILGLPPLAEVRPFRMQPSSIRLGPAGSQTTRDLVIDPQYLR